MDGKTVHNGTQEITSNKTTDLGIEHNIRYITTNILSDRNFTLVLSVTAESQGERKTGNVTIKRTNGNITISDSYGYMEFNNRNFAVCSLSYSVSVVSFAFD